MHEDPPDDEQRPWARLTLVACTLAPLLGPFIVLLTAVFYFGRVGLRLWP